MSRSAFVEVNITNPTRLAQDSQDTADKAVRGVENLNDPNMMNVIEKQNNIVQFAGLTSQYNVLVQNAKDEGIDITAVTTAYNNLNIFMADILADPDHASDIDRARYKKYQDAYNEELAKLQNALQNNTNDKFTSAASAISQAASTANVAKSAADSAYTYANSEIAVQSTATAKAQSAADGAFSQAQVIGSQADSAIAAQSTATAKAQSAADSALAKAEEVDGKTSAEIAKQSAATAKAQEAATSALDKAQSAADYTDEQIASQASAVSEVSKTAAEASSKANSALDTANGANAEIVKLRGGSTVTIAQLEDGLGTKVSNDTFDSYQTQTASQFAQTVKEADFKTYQTQTSELIESKVDNGTYQTDKTQTAEAIASKVSSGEFETYQAQTDKALSSKVSSSDYKSDREQTASQIADKVSNGEFSTYKTQTDELIGSKVDNGDFKTYQTQTAELINSKVDNGTYQSDKTQTANQIASKVSSADFNSYKSQTDKAIISKVESKDFQTLQTQVNNSTVGTNLFSQSTATSGYIDSGTGNVDPASSFQNEIASDYIPVSASSAYTFQMWGTTPKGNYYWYGIGQYDSDKKFISRPSGAGATQSADTTEHVSKTLTTTSATAYVRVSFRKYNDFKAKFEKGSVATDYSVNPEDQATNSQITQLSGQIDQKVSSGDFNSYKTQTDELIGQKVDNGAFKTYQNQTAELIASKVDNGTYQSDKTQTANAIASKVSSDDFKTYQTQTDKLIDSKVDNGTYQSDKTQTANQIADKVSNGAFNTYKTQTDKLIAEKVSNGDFSTYKSQTADLISQKVATKDFEAYQTTTAQQIASKVTSTDFNSYKSQTDNAILSKVSKKDANNVNLIPYSSNFSDSLEGWQLMAWGATDKQLLAVTHNFYQNGTGKLLQLYTAQNATSAAGSLRFSVLPNTKYTFQFKAFASSNVVGANVYFLSRAYGSTKDYDTVHGLFTSLVTSPSHIDQYTVTFTTGANDNEGYIRVDNIGSNNGASSGLFFTELKMEPGDTATPYVYGGQDSMISQMSDNINLRVTKDGLLDQINLQAGKTLISSSGQLTLSANSVFLDSANPVIMKSANIDTLLVGKKLTAADIAANTFTTNNGTFTVSQNGAITAKDMTLNGGKLYSPTINAGTITGVTINGATFHGGDVINNQHNTSHFYPMTIESNGTYKTTFYDQMVGLQSIIESGGLQHKFRSMVAGSDGHFTAYNSALDGQGFHSQSGYTTSKDSDFNKPQTITGYVDVTPATGIYLYGPTQQINFAGKSGNIGSNGMTMDAYGNIRGQSDSAWWRIGDVNGNQIINFGIDKAGSNYTEFKRNIQVGNIGINTAHSITMQDGKGLYINSGKGGRADLNVASLNYQGSVSKSLLSEKKGVKKTDTAYWAQLVNSIDLATYQYKDDDNTSNLRLSGIVDDVNEDKQWNLPDIFVARDEDGKLSGIENIVLQNAMLATIQEQQKEIDKLNGHLLELEAKLNG
ncbi:hypothetical protein [Lactobacillus phage Satyr]|uniref:Peptidase S74 domain-containing protein n=1 Tax=Lactobacillus phage Satyr TaxID=2070201 RepID=A0A2K9V5E9_9CAUD|nr:tail fiber protein [Lactobacillus phage Satyr]AUV57333.1 hypothetical protein [Lactobacillus phage Satyr]